MDTMSVGEGWGGPIAWEEVIHKIVRTREGNLIGNVDAVDENSIFVSTDGRRTTYRIPKEVIEGFDGYVVLLKLGKSELERFKTSADKSLESQK